MTKMPVSHIIPLGFFCSPTEWLIQLGMRQDSYPFDWVICSMAAVNHLIETHFEDLFDLADLSCEINDHCVVTHQSYFFQSFHDFSKNWDLERQVSKVKAKYAHRIADFYNVLKSGQPVLFLRYLQPEVDEAAQIDRFIALIRTYTLNFKLLLLYNTDTTLGQIHQPDFILKCFEVEKASNDSVQRQLPAALAQYLTQAVEWFF